MTHLHSEGHRARSRGIVVVAALMLAASLAACGPADDTARQFQERVLGVSQAAASNDHPGALKTLADLEADVTAAAGGGRVSEERRQSIMSKITAVRAELTSAVDAAAAAKAAEEAAAAAAAEKVKADAEAAAAAAAAATPKYTAPVVAVPAPAPPPAPEKKKGNEGKGKDKKG